MGVELSLNAFRDGFARLFDHRVGWQMDPGSSGFECRRQPIEMPVSPSPHDQVKKDGEDVPFETCLAWRTGVEISQPFDCFGDRIDISRAEGGEIEATVRRLSNA